MQEARAFEIALPRVFAERQSLDVIEKLRPTDARAFQRARRQLGDAPLHGLDALAFVRVRRLPSGQRAAMLLLRDLLERDEYVVHFANVVFVLQGVAEAELVCLSFSVAAVLQEEEL